MSDNSLQRNGSFEGVLLPKSTDFSVFPAQPSARFILRGEAAAVATFGVRAPARLRAECSDTGRAALWLGPDEWLLIAPGEDLATVKTAFEATTFPAPYSLVDISSRQIGLILDGILSARCLSSGCPLDLRIKNFPIGMVARTIYLKTEIILWRQATNTFQIDIWRSFAPYLIGHLAEAMTGATGA